MTQENQDKVYGIVGKEMNLEDFKVFQKEHFQTRSEDEQSYNGKPFTILRALNESEVDLIAAPMFKIQFEDGTQKDAFMDEIFKDELFEKSVTLEHLVRD